MKKITFYIILLHGLFLGTAPANAKLSTGNTVNNSSQPHQRVQYTPTPLHPYIFKQAANIKQATKPLIQKPEQVWVIDQKQEVKDKPFIWIVDDIKKAAQQPYLKVGKSTEKPEKKPTTESKPEKKDDLESFNEVVKDTEKLEGVFTLYRNKEKNQIYLEVKPEQLNKNFLATATLESGIGEQGIYSGLPLQDFLFYFQRVDKKLSFVVRNVNFRTREGDPQARSLARSFSDSVLYSVEIKSIHPQRKTLLIDLSDILLSDLSGLALFTGLTANKDQSYFGNAKAFPQNLEIESVLHFSGGSGSGQSNEALYFSTVPDSRGFTLRVHYSLSQLPDNNYLPRLADERVGYFITAYQDLSKEERNDPFVRYINRWHLEKKDPDAPISRPKKPIVFWIDNAVPLRYRESIKEGVLMWNKAFLKAGFKDAIEVKQMPDNATWDPADIRYNTIRWINTVDGYFAMGPSRVNPLTGEILDADILVDASLVRLLKSRHGTLIEPNQTSTRTSLSEIIRNRGLCSNNGFAGKVNNRTQEKSTNPKGFLQRLSKLAGDYDLCYGIEAANQFTFGALSMSLLQNTPPNEEEVQQYIHQYLRLIIAHEVGHTLGLRHNFRGSNLLSPEEMNNEEVSRHKGLTSSVMDYLPPNIAPKGTKQGDYFPNTVGAYDDWAILYGYTQTNAKTAIAEKPILQEIASKSDQPELSYSPDEDMYDLDPTADAWDHSSNVLVYSQWQLDNSRLMWTNLNKRFPMPGESYSDLSDRFSSVLSNYFQNIFYTTKYIGGQSFYRLRAGENSSTRLASRQNRLPFEPVPVEQQRQALKTLQKYIFAEDALNFSPELLNKLAPSRWYHWGSFPRIGRLDYPVHDLILFLQGAVLRELLSGDRLTRIKDIELKSTSENSLTLPELFDTLQTDIWTEVLKPKPGEVKITSLRRGLQREHLDILIAMVLRREYVPEDARSLAWYKLKQLNDRLKSVNTKDEYTKAHLLEASDRIDKAMNAPLQAN
jgi:hypothetical protein